MTKMMAKEKHDIMEKTNAILKWTKCMAPRAFKPLRTFRVFLALLPPVEAVREVSTLLCSHLMDRNDISYCNQGTIN